MPLLHNFTESRGQLKNSYRRFLTGSNCSSRTISNYSFYVDDFINDYWDHLIKVDSVDQLNALCNEYINLYSSSSSKRLIRTALRHLVRYLGFDPEVIKVRIPKVVKNGVKHLTPEQVCAILEEANGQESEFFSKRNTAMLAIFAFLGLRLSELQGLITSDIDFDKNRIRVLGKGNKVGYVPLIKAVRPYISAWLNVKNTCEHNNSVWITKTGKTLSKRAIQYIVTGYVKEFDASLSTHSLRHTAATTLINSGVELKTVSTLLRHTNLSTTADIYAHKSVESVGDDMNKVYGG